MSRVVTIFAGSMSLFMPAAAFMGHSTNSYARSWWTGPASALCIGHSDGGDAAGDEKTDNVNNLNLPC